MRTTLAIVFAVAAILTVAAQDQQVTFKTSISSVAVYATVSDRSGRLVTDLTRDDFEVLDDGKPVQMTTFSNEPQPLAVALMLDMSTSIVKTAMRIRDAAGQFVRALGPDDRVRIGTFGDEIGISPLLTSDRAELDRILHEELWPGGATPLWNALTAAMQSLDGQAGRRALVSLTDGDNSSSLPEWPGTQDEVEKKALDDGFMLFAIGIEGAGVDKRFARLVEQTGGIHFDVQKDGDLAGTFAKVAEELRHQYLLGFQPRALDGKTHKLEVRVKRPGHTVRARKTYLAVAGK
jgi:Ca-activated chloride channel family protein